MRTISWERLLFPNIRCLWVVLPEARSASPNQKWRQSLPMSLCMCILNMVGFSLPYSKMEAPFVPLPRPPKAIRNTLPFCRQLILQGDPPSRHTNKNNKKNNPPTPKRQNTNGSNCLFHWASRVVLRLEIHLRRSPAPWPAREVG